MSKSSTRTRLERLEAAVATKTTPPYRQAFIEAGSYDLDGEQHLVMVSPPGQVRCYFQQVPWPGPQLADFGEFSLVLCLTPAEMEA